MVEIKTLYKIGLSKVSINKSNYKSTNLNNINPRSKNKFGKLIRYNVLSNTGKSIFKDSNSKPLDLNKRKLKKLSLINDNLNQVLEHKVNTKNMGSKLPKIPKKKKSIVKSLISVKSKVGKVFTDKAIVKKKIINDRRLSDVILEKPFEKITLDKDNMNSLMDELTQKTSNISKDDDQFIEQISFLGSKPKISKIKIKNLDVTNLYSKIDSLADEMILKESNKKNSNLEDVSDKSKIYETSKNKFIIKNKKSKTNNLRAIIEEFDIPKILSIDDDIKNTSVMVSNDSYSSKEVDSHNNHNQRSNFVDDDKKGIKLNPELKKSMAKLDRLKNLKKINKKRDALNININLGKDVSSIKGQTKKDSLTNKDSDNINYNNMVFSSNVDSNPISSYNVNDTLSNNSTGVEGVQSSYNSGPINQSDSFILPKDSNNYVADSKIKSQFISHSIPSRMINANNNFAINSANGESFSNLVYSIPIISSYNVKEINDQYSIDEFTFVTITNLNKKLIYNIVQPELDDKQIEIFSEIKRLFLDSIDQNYYSFRGDKQSIIRYIKKVYDLTISKLSYNINSLDKKLYFSFIEKDFSGLGFLSALLNDKHIIEVSCSGIDSPIIVYHVKYGAIETNLNFESIAKLNIFVLSLTKLMGLQINSNNPIINGYLPNGYKVEGLYSVGDISSKGSSFVIKKYLEEPLTPVSLINLGVGACDIFAYIWCAIDAGYNIIINGTSDKTLVLNSIALFYPESQIISVQKQDDLKLPQKNWIKRIVYDNAVVNTKTILNQSISEKPDYLIVDDFTSDLFDSQWYSINLLSSNNKIFKDYIDKAKLIGQKTISIELNRVKMNSKDYIQFNKIIEYNKNEENLVVNLESNNEFKLNLLSSDISIVEFKKRKEIVRWMIDSKIVNYKDFNSIISDYKVNKEKLLSKLGIIKV